MAMYNECIDEHAEQFPHCKGKSTLYWDLSKEQQWGLCWIEQMFCAKCSYKSKPYPLYKEVDGESTKGRKAANINRGIHVGLSQTPIGPTSLRRVLMSVHVPPPSKAELQKSANKVCSNICEVNKLDMQRRREDLKKINKLRNEPEHVINIECDGAYNNKLYSGVGRTLMQPATQCNYVVAENVTGKRQIIAMTNVNKLCSKHGFHSEIDSTCDIKKTKCSTTDPMESSIGNEGEWASRSLGDLKESGLEVKYMTTDPDTKAFLAAQDLFDGGVTSTEPKHLLDSRHLTENHRKFIKKNTVLLNNMPATTKSDKESLLSLFAMDLSKRCQAECEALPKTSTKIFSQLPILIETIINCYCGDHGLCVLHSKVCDSLNSKNWITKSVYLLADFCIKRNDATYKALSECIKYRICESRIEKTVLNSNSQKVEATNRVIRRSVPTNVTYPRNFDGRSQSAVHNLNCGPGESMTKLLSAEGCPVPSGSKVAKSLKKEQELNVYHKKYNQNPASKLKRCIRRRKLFDMYREHKEEMHYRKAQLLEAGYRLRRSHTKLKKSIRTDHLYHTRSQPKNKQ
ncbi:hypothetical protein FSP39_004584 [Pinctada imbricata]|uniref:Mutator-like transposase domain-containing protein n=1 Tax=Pinctada imbricata TaxID=66713 RepID=A0AA88YSW2_PINIB|nr:hypothetical protein FSP39_004584 [Pinctada imbricata]